MRDQLGNLTLSNVGNKTSHGVKAVIPEGAMCFICLGEGDDDEGGPLVRDCSCRGDSAGFAHLSCIIQTQSKKAGRPKKQTWENSKNHGRDGTSLWNASIYFMHASRSNVYNILVKHWL